MTTVGLYGNSTTGVVPAASGAESTGLYGNNVNFGGSYFEWFIFQQSDAQPATPTGGSWNFSTNSGTPPTGWSSTPFATPTNKIWVSIALVNSKNTTALAWSAPGLFSYSSGLPILSGSGAPQPTDGQSDQLWIQTDTTPETIWFKQSGTWTRLSGSSLYVDLTNNQTIAGTKTFSSQIQGSISGTASNVTGVVGIANGGTGATTASSARAALGAAASGANNDITSLSGITGAIATADYVQFDTTYAATLGVGQVGWDGNNTLGLGMAGGQVVQKIGEDLFYYIKASSAITKGQVIMFTGAVGASGVVTGAPATGVSDGSYIMGIAAENIALNGFGLVQFQGTLKGFDTSAFSNGDILWYNPAVTGGLTATKPSAPNIKVQIAAVINSGNGGSGSVLIRVSAGSVLGGTDSNVQFGTLSNNDVIQYDATAGYWKNVPSTTAAVTTFSGGTTGLTPATATSGAVTLAGTLALANGGTGATTASGARTNLGLGTSAVLNAGVANGVATLDAGGTVPLSQIPASIQGGVSYQGTWNASTNTPTLTSGVGTKGYYYVVSVAGSTNLNGITDWKIGDWAIFNGTAWEKVDNTDAVTSVNGYTGTVVLSYTDVGAPSTTGTNATGTWGINISGNAATSTIANNVSGVVAIANGGTGQTTANSAFNALVPSQTGNSGKFLTTDGTNTSWATNPLGTVTSVSGTGSVSGLTLTGTVTTSGSLTLGGSLNLSSPPTIGNTTPNTGAFTTLTASADSAFTSTGALTISKGTTAQQPGSATTGMIRYNTTTNQFEGYSGATPAWKSIGGSTLSNDTATASNLYPVFASSTTGTAENLYTSNSQYLYKPSTGELSVKAPRASNGIFVNTQSISVDYTIATGDNGLSAGPVSVASGITVTVSTGSVWTIV